MPGVHLRGSAAYFRENLLQQYHKSVLRWIDILTLHQRIDEAVRIAEKAIPFDPTHEPLVKSLCTLLAHSGQTLKAWRVIRQFQKALARDGCSQPEIDAIMDDFWIA
jgi:DNA-binding SARP family transcriptional activator